MGQAVSGICLPPRMLRGEYGADAGYYSAAARVRKRNTRIALPGSGDPERLVSGHAPVGRSGEAIGKHGRAAVSKAMGSC